MGDIRLSFVPLLEEVKRAELECAYKVSWQTMLLFHIVFTAASDGKKTKASSAIPYTKMTKASLLRKRQRVGEEQEQLILASLKHNS